jgi:hypothetical protein
MAGLACSGALEKVGQLDDQVRAVARDKAVQACRTAAKDLPKGSEDAICSCVADEVLGKLTPKDLAEMAEKGPDPAKVKSAAKRCAKKAR